MQWPGPSSQGTTVIVCHPKPQSDSWPIVTSSTACLSGLANSHLPRPFVRQSVIPGSKRIEHVHLIIVTRKEVLQVSQSQVQVLSGADLLLVKQQRLACRQQQPLCRPVPLSAPLRKQQAASVLMLPPIQQERWPCCCCSIASSHAAGCS